MYLCVLLKCYLPQTKEKKKTYQASEKLGHKDHWRTYIVTQNNKCYNTATDKMKMYIYIYIYIYACIYYIYVHRYTYKYIHISCKHLFYIYIYLYTYTCIYMKIM